MELSSTKDNNLKSFNINIPLLIKSFLIGVLLTEVVLIAKLFTERVLILLNTNGTYLLHLSSKTWLCVIAVSYFLIILSYLFRRDFWHSILIVLKSFRFDLLIILFAGSALTFSFGGFYLDFFNNKFFKLDYIQVIVVSLLPTLVFISIGIRNIQVKLTKINNEKSFFVSDNEIEDEDDDKFNFNEKAERFAERVFNQGSPESLVFGIDAPWGTGKSSFINLCKKHWMKNYNNKIIIYSFNPLRYESQENLLEKFIDGLIKEIKYHAFVPEVEYIVSKYAKLLKSTKASFSFWGVSIGLPFGGESIDNVFDRLEATLSIVGKKIVIVVDDLDRLHFSSIKEVLFVIKKAFTLPNISYVLCYDTENITALEQAGLDTEKISEFLEKFINVKTSLYLDNELLLKYFSVSKDQSLAKNLLANTELVSKAVEGLKDIFTSKDFHNYLPFIGDARKLKRLVNTILLLEVEKTDFDNCDFNKQDLIHLLIIYISYPNIFRKIYNTETKGKKGFFSLVSQYEDGYPKDKLAQSSGYFYYENSEKYKKYLDTLSKPQKFIINKIFNASERQIDGNGTTINSSHNIPSEIYTSYACFNGSMWNIEGKNLEKYLNLITAMSRPHKVEQYKFYINAKNRLLSEKAIEEVFKEDDFSFLNGEATQEKLWRVLVNTNSGEFSVEKSKEIISYSLDILPKYSLIEIGKVEIGFRNTLPFFIVKLLDRVGWTDAEGKHSYHNTDENVVKIAHWIFGEDDHKEEGILDILAKEERGVMGLHDLLLFRLSCCTDRGGDIFNLSRALSKHGDPNAPTSGSVRAIVIEEMREMSQKVFGVFKTQYIDKKKNIFDEIDKLTLSEVCGENYGHVKAKIESGNIENIDVQLLILKSRLKSFMIYQLGNVMISSGIGCGYYNFTGKEDEKNKEGINLSINEYLFDYCFNPEINEGNYRHFLDYLLLNFAHSIGGYSDRFKYRPHINEFTKVLNNTTLACYWESHGAKIKSKRYESEDKKIFTGNYIASYKEDLESTFKVLDGLINSQQDN